MRPGEAKESAMARLDEIEARANAATPGHSEERFGPIALGCIAPEARELLDAAHAGWLEHRKAVAERNPGYPKDDAYAALYWLIRWSGLVLPSARQDVPALVRALRVALSGLADECGLWTGWEGDRKECEPGPEACPPCAKRYIALAELSR